jgi:hypothetical protein
VDRVLSQAGLPKLERPHRPSQLGPFLPFVGATLEKYPRLTASRLYALVRGRGYPGDEGHFRHLLIWRNRSSDFSIVFLNQADNEASNA